MKRNYIYYICVWDWMKENRRRLDTLYRYATRGTLIHTLTHGKRLRKIVYDWRRRSDSLSEYLSRWLANCSRCLILHSVYIAVSNRQRSSTQTSCVNCLCVDFPSKLLDSFGSFEFTQKLVWRRHRCKSNDRFDIFLVWFHSIECKHFIDSIQWNREHAWKRN